MHAINKSNTPTQQVQTVLSLMISFYCQYLVLLIGMECIKLEIIKKEKQQEMQSVQTACTIDDGMRFIQSSSIYQQV